MVRTKTSLKKSVQNTQRCNMPVTLEIYFPKGFLREDQVENANMTTSMEIEDKDATGEVEVLAKPTKENSSFVELNLSLLQSIIHNLFELTQLASQLLVDVLQECDGRSWPDVHSLDSSSSQMLWHDESPIVTFRVLGAKVTSGFFPLFPDTSTTTFDGCSSFGAFTSLSGDDLSFFIQIFGNHLPCIFEGLD
ncbi:hypothetical protein ACH5RR_029149 [Cinchona calisaya]|uniref:Uncharacterized protein n=1 Tax=Cinchona calisaya TaxID=153742 RepID=A0ABD2YW32_9GENT